MAMLERYLEIINTVLQTRRHKYKTLIKSPKELKMSTTATSTTKLPTRY